MKLSGHSELRTLNGCVCTQCNARQANCATVSNTLEATRRHKTYNVMRLRTDQSDPASILTGLITGQMGVPAGNGGIMNVPLAQTCGEKREREREGKIELASPHTCQLQANMSLHSPQISIIALAMMILTWLIRQIEYQCLVGLGYQQQEPSTYNHLANPPSAYLPAGIPAHGLHI